MDYAEVYFAIASVSTIIVAGLLIISLLYFFSILYDVKRLSKIARREAEMIAKGLEKGVGAFGSKLSDETAGFVKAIFALLLSHFAPVRKTSRGRKVDGIKNS